MHKPTSYYDVAIVGGGLAGLATAIIMGSEGYKVVLFEKETYPFHKVCGEYISFESWIFLHSLGLPLPDWKLPEISTLFLSSPDGAVLQQSLPLGGFGVSRYKIDHALVERARYHHAEIKDGTRVQNIHFQDDHFVITAGNETITAALCCGAFGKRSNIDVKWKRNFVRQRPNALNNYIGVKYHAQFDHPSNVIALHNFKNGYCGISPIEDRKVCVCYLTTAQNLRDYNNDIATMEREVLFKNPYLQEAFKKAVLLYNTPLTISQISFDKKEQVQEHVLLLGDAAGMITPLCGNGMSMALQGSRIASELMLQYLAGSFQRKELEKKYIQQWNNAFSNRLTAGRIIQGFFGKEWLTNFTIRALRPFPGLVSHIIRQTHG